jgi:hypothetical protein
VIKGQRKSENFSKDYRNFGGGVSRQRGPGDVRKRHFGKEDISTLVRADVRVGQRHTFGKM